MKKNVLVKVGERTENYSVVIPAEYDDDGALLEEEHEEVRQRVVPIMESQYVEMTDEEIAELNAQIPQEEHQDPVCARVKECEDALCELAEMLSEVIG